MFLILKVKCCFQLSIDLLIYGGKLENQMEKKFTVVWFSLPFLSCLSLLLFPCDFLAKELQQRQAWKKTIFIPKGKCFLLLKHSKTPIWSCVFEYTSAWYLTNSWHPGLQGWVMELISNNWKRGGIAVKGVKIYHPKWTGIRLNLRMQNKLRSLFNLVSLRFHLDSCKPWTS